MTTNTTSEPSPGLIRTYAARPAQIEACQLDYDGENAADILDWIRAEGGTAERADGDCLRVNTFDGVDTALPGWWVVHHPGKEFDVFDPANFIRYYIELREARK